MPTWVHADDRLPIRPTLRCMPLPSMETRRLKQRRTLGFQIRLIVCGLAGVVCAAAATPFVMPFLEFGNVVVAGALGAVLFFLVATIAGLVWQPSIKAAPVRWALAAPPAIAVTLYLGLRLLSGFDAGEASLDLEVGLVSGFCAIFASAIFVIGTAVAPVQEN